MTDKPPEDPGADPEGWARFERAVDVALHTPAKHKPKAKGESSQRKDRKSRQG